MYHGSDAILDIQCLIIMVAKNQECRLSVILNLIRSHVLTREVIHCCNATISVLPFTIRILHAPCLTFLTSDSERLAFQMLKFVFCARLYTFMYITINTDDRRIAAKEKHFACKHLSSYYDNNLLVTHIVHTSGQISCNSCTNTCFCYVCIFYLHCSCW